VCGPFPTLTDSDLMAAVELAWGTVAALDFGSPPRSWESCTSVGFGSVFAEFQDGFCCLGSFGAGGSLIPGPYNAAYLSAVEGAWRWGTPPDDPSGCHYVDPLHTTYGAEAWGCTVYSFRANADPMDGSLTRLKPGPLGGIIITPTPVLGIVVPQVTAVRSRIYTTSPFCVSRRFGHTAAVGGTFASDVLTALDRTSVLADLASHALCGSVAPSGGFIELPYAGYDDDLTNFPPFRGLNWGPEILDGVSLAGSELIDCLWLCDQCLDCACS
jgi:hypothetical protein